MGNHPNSFFTSALAYEKATKKAEQRATKSAPNVQGAEANANEAGNATNEDPQAKDIEMQAEAVAEAVAQPAETTTQWPVSHPNSSFKFNSLTLLFKRTF